MLGKLLDVKRRRSPAKDDAIRSDFDLQVPNSPSGPIHDVLVDQVRGRLGLTAHNDGILQYQSQVFKKDLDFRGSDSVSHGGKSRLCRFSMQNADQTRLTWLRGANGLTPDELRLRLQQGWKAVRFEYCFSFLIATVRCRSVVYLTENWQERYIHGMGYNVVTLLLGPWGVPWGLVGTARSLWTNLTGGVDVSAELLDQSREVATTTAALS